LLCTGDTAEGDGGAITVRGRSGKSDAGNPLAPEVTTADSRPSVARVGTAGVEATAPAAMDSDRPVAPLPPQSPGVTPSEGLDPPGRDSMGFATEGEA